MGFLVVATLSSIFSPYISITLLMNFSGAIVCYLFIYLVPTKIHYTCLYPKSASNSVSEKEMCLNDDMST